MNTRRKKHPDVAVVIPAGGSGRRMGGGIPKQFRRLNGEMLFLTTLRAFDALAFVREIILVVPPDSLERVRRACRRAGIAVTVTAGGGDRQESVRKGLAAITTNPEVVLVHDAVRPFVSRSLITRVAEAAREHCAAVPGMPVTDTLRKEGPSGRYAETIDRTGLWAIQTPQGFTYDLLLRAHRKAERERFVGTDEAGLVERLDVKISIIRGDSANFKITTPEDFVIARKMLR